MLYASASFSKRSASAGFIAAPSSFGKCFLKLVGPQRYLRSPISTASRTSLNVISRFLFRFVPYGLMVRGNGPFTLVERYDRKRKFAACHSVDALNRNASSALAGDGHVFVASAAPAIGLWRGSHDFIGFDPAIGGSLRIIQ